MPTVIAIDSTPAAQTEAIPAGSALAAANNEGARSEPVCPVRRCLPDERWALTHHFSIAGQEGYLTVGVYEDGLPGEIFITMAKQGSTISGLMDAFATVTSLALQHGVPLRVLARNSVICALSLAAGLEIQRSASPSRLWTTSHDGLNLSS